MIREAGVYPSAFAKRQFPLLHHAIKVRYNAYENQKRLLDGFASRGARASHKVGAECGAFNLPVHIHLGQIYHSMKNYASL